MKNCIKCSAANANLTKLENGKFDYICCFCNRIKIDELSIEDKKNDEKNKMIKAYGQRRFEEMEKLEVGSMHNSTAGKIEVIAFRYFSKIQIKFLESGTIGWTTGKAVLAGTCRDPQNRVRDQKKSIV